VANYPTPLEDIHVRVVRTLREEFNLLTGLSDHTVDPVIAPAAAVALGASVVEKHITMDKSMEGPDHQFALEPDELKKMVGAIRGIEVALGSPEKEVLDIEEELHRKARRTIQVVENINAGDKFTEENISVLRPGECTPGLHPKFFDEIIGKTAENDLQEGDGVQWNDVCK
jgi:N-acetylneuraminate synthase